MGEEAVDMETGEVLEVPEFPDENSIYARLAYVAQTAEAVAKRHNPNLGFAVRGIEEILSMLKPHLSAAGIVIVPSVTEHARSEYDTSSGTTMQRSFLRVEYRLAAPDGSFITSTVEGEASDHADKATSKAMTAAFKSMLLQVFAIPTAEADAGDGSAPEGGRTLKPGAPGMVNEKQAKLVLARARAQGEPHSVHGYEIINAALSAGQLDSLPHRASGDAAREHLMQCLASARLDGMLAFIEAWQPPQPEDSTPSPE